MVEMTAQVLESKPWVGVVIADVGDGVADEGLEVDIGLGGDLTGDDDEAGAGEGLAGDAAVGILGEAGVEDGV